MYWTHSHHQLKYSENAFHHIVLALRWLWNGLPECSLRPNLINIPLTRKRLQKWSIFSILALILAWAGPVSGLLSYCDHLFRVRPSARGPSLYSPVFFPVLLETRGLLSCVSAPSKRTRDRPNETSRSPSLSVLEALSHGSASVGPGQQFLSLASEPNFRFRRFRS